MDCGLPGSPVHRILQVRILEWVTMPCSRGSIWPRDPTHMWYVSCITGRFFTTEPLGSLTYHTLSYIFHSQCLEYLSPPVFKFLLLQSSAQILSFPESFLDSYRQNNYSVFHFQTSLLYLAHTAFQIILELFLSIVSLLKSQYISYNKGKTMSWAFSHSIGLITISRSEWKIQRYLWKVVYASISTHEDKKQ